MLGAAFTIKCATRSAGCEKVDVSDHKRTQLKCLLIPCLIFNRNLDHKCKTALMGLNH